VKIYRPYPSDTTLYPPPAPAHHGGPNLFTPIYQKQREYHAAQQSLVFLQAYLKHNGKREKSLANHKVGGSRFAARSEDGQIKGENNTGSSFSKSGRNTKKQQSSKLLGSPASFASSVDTHSDRVSSHRLSLSSTKGPRRNSLFNLRLDSNNDAVSGSSDKQPRVVRPTLTQSGVKPIHRSSTVDFERSSSAGTGSDDVPQSTSPPFSGSFLRTSTGNTAPITTSDGNVSTGFNQICITVPRQLRIDNLRIDSPVLPSIAMRSVKTFKDLLQVARGLASESGLLSPEQNQLGIEGFALNISGTRSFLPDQDFDIKFLPAFVAEAFSVDLFDDEIDEMFIDYGHFDVHAVSDPGEPKRERSQTFVDNGSVFELTLIAEMEKLNVQSRICVARRGLLEQKIKLVNDKKSSVTIVEGEPGSGKTEVLANFVARCLPNTAPIYVTTGSPFFGHAPHCGVWATVIQQYLDLVIAHEAKANPSKPESTKVKPVGITSRYFPRGNGKKQELSPPTTQSVEEKRAEVLLSELEKAGCSQELLSEAYVLNDLLKVDLPSPTDQYRPSEEEEKKTRESVDELAHTQMNSLLKEDQIKKIMILLLHRICDFRPSIIIFDNAMFLDDFSWDLAHDIANEELPKLKLMIVFATRPIANYLCRYSVVSDHYHNLVSIPCVKFLKLDGLPPEEIEEFICSMLGPNVDCVSDSLFKMLEERAMGNPFVAIELINALVEKKLLAYKTINSEGEAGERGTESGGDDSSSDEDNSSPFKKKKQRKDSNDSTSSPTRTSAPNYDDDDEGEINVDGEIDNILNTNPTCSIIVSLSKRFKIKSLPSPDKVMKLLASRLDRLNSCQQGILKVAAVVLYCGGSNLSLCFKWSTMMNVYPVEGHKGHLWKELLSLEDLGVLMQVGRSINPLTKAADYEFRFAYASMCDVVLSRMLVDHRELLEESVSKYNAGVQKSMRQEQMAKMAEDMANTGKRLGNADDEGLSFCSGTLHIQRRTTTSFLTMKVKRKIQQGGEWKDRFCILKPQGMYMYKEQDDTTPTQIIWLKGASAEIEKRSQDAFNEKWVFRVEASRWEKNGKQFDIRRTFVFAATSKTNMDNWVYMTRYVIESIESKGGEGGIGECSGGGRGGEVLGAGVNKVRSKRDISEKKGRRARSYFISPAMNFNKDDPETLEGEGELSLIVAMKRGACLINNEVFGTSNPYGLLLVEDLHCRTEAAKLASVDPEWNENFVFPIEMKQWANRTELELQIWNRDVYLSDDFLGFSKIDIGDLDLEAWREGEEEDGVGLDRLLKVADSQCKGNESNKILDKVKEKGESESGGVGGEEDQEELPQGRSFWLNLESRKEGEIVRGKLLVHCWLVMSKESRTEFGSMNADDIRNNVLGKGGYELKPDLVVEPESVFSRQQESSYIEDQEQHRLNVAAYEVKALEKIERNAVVVKPDEMEGAAAVVGAGDVKDLEVEPTSSPELSEIGGRRERRERESSNNSMESHYGSNPKDYIIQETIDQLHYLIESVEQRRSTPGGINSRRASTGQSPSFSDHPDDSFITEQLKQILTFMGTMSAGGVALQRSASRGEEKQLGKLVNAGAVDDKEKEWMMQNFSHVHRESIAEESSMTYSNDEHDGNALKKERNSLKGGLAKRKSRASRQSWNYRASASSVGGAANRVGSPFDGESFLDAISAGHVEDGVTDGGVVVYYKDFTGTTRGPFTARELYYWYEAGYMHEQVPVCVGGEPISEDNEHGVPFVPLAVFLDTLRAKFGTKPSWTMESGGVDRVIFSQEVDSWNFNIFEVKEDDLWLVGSDVMNMLCLPITFSILESNFVGLMSNVRYLMTRNGLTYHNYYHALDVMQTSCAFISQFELGKYLTDLEVLSLVIGAVCHDLDHPGVTNAYLNSVESDLSLRYNDVSTLENMHAALTFEILKKDGCDVFSEVEKGMRVQARKLIIACIINTDMTYHFSLINDLNECTARVSEMEKNTLEKGGQVEQIGYGRRSSMSSSMSSTKGASDMVDDLFVSDGDREIILKALLHVADISNPVKPWEMSKEWSDRVMVEFFAQGDTEKAQGLPVSMNMDRDTTNQAELSLNFCDFIVAPFFLAFVNIAPKLIDAVMVMDNNRAKWDELHFEWLKTKGGDKLSEDIARWEKRKATFESSIAEYLP